MRIVFMGSPDFAVPSLDALVADGHDIAAVYSQPPRPAGRGKALRPTPVAQRAADLGFDVLTPASLKDPQAQARFAAFDADVAIVAAYGLILPQPVLDAPRRGCVNVHASLLPRWRGAAPVHRAIMAGDEQTGVTIMQMEKGLDTGPMILKEELAIGDSNSLQLTERLARLGAKLIARWASDPDGLKAEAQPDDATYAAKIDKTEARIDWTQDAHVVQRHIQALAPFPGAWTNADGERIKLLGASVVNGTGEAGHVIDGFTIACGTGAVKIARAQRAGKGPQDAGVLLRGFKLPNRLT